MAGKITAKALIESKKKQQAVAMPNAEALKQLQEILEYNDRAANNNSRINIESAAKLMTDYGFQCARDSLNRICRELGRKSYRNP